MKSFIEYLTDDTHTSDYRIKKYIDSTGKTRTKKIQAHHIDFKNSKHNAEPAQQDEPPR